MKKLFLIILLLVYGLFAQDYLPQKTTAKKSSVTIYSSGSFLSDFVGIVAKGDTLIITGIDTLGWYEVEVNNITGFVRPADIVVSDDLATYRKTYMNEFHLEKVRKSQAKEKIVREQKKKKRLNKMVKKYGKKKGTGIAKGRVRLGYSTEMVKDAVGRPKDINRTVGNWGVHEQWVYDSYYLYFENGILTSWQE